jgi:hypothetical protein
MGRRDPGDNPGQVPAHHYQPLGGVIVIMGTRLKGQLEKADLQTALEVDARTVSLGAGQMSIQQRDCLVYTISQNQRWMSGRLRAATPITSHSPLPVSVPKPLLRAKAHWNPATPQQMHLVIIR